MVFLFVLTHHHNNHHHRVLSSLVQKSIGIKKNTYCTSVIRFYNRTVMSKTSIYLSEENLVSISKPTINRRRNYNYHYYSSSCFSSHSSSDHNNNNNNNSIKYRNDPKSIKEDDAYCVALVKQRDGEGYLCGLLMPETIKKSYFALRAFNVEVASIKDSYNVRNSGIHGIGNNANDVSSIMALQLRINWWKNAIDQIYESDDNTKKKPSTTIPNSNFDFHSISTSCWNNPVVRSLHRAVQRSRNDIANTNTDTTKSTTANNTNTNTILTKRFLEQIIDARGYDLEITQYETMKDLINYCDDTVVSLLCLSLESAGIVNNDSADRVAYHAGIGIGLATAIRSTPFRLVFKEIPIPAELFRPMFPFSQLIDDQYRDGNENKITLTDSDSKQFHDAIKYITSVAIEHITIARNLQGTIPTSLGKPCILLPLIPTIHYLNKLQESDYNIFHPNVNSPTSKRIQLLWLLSRTWLTNVV